MKQTQLSRIRDCFNYRGANLSKIDETENGIRVIPGPPWDIEWCTVDLFDKNYTLKLMWKGRKESPFTWSNLTFSKVIQTLKFYRG